MLKNKKDRPCDCGSGHKFGKCCGHPIAIKAKKLAEGRDCGTCQACCELMGVRELGKPYATRCQHQCSSGCAIYEARPYGCRVFECLWRMMPDMPLDMRPDKSGIMLYADRASAGGKALYLCEVWPDAFANMPDGFVKFMENYVNETQGKAVLVPYGKSQGVDFRNSAQYAANDSFGKQQKCQGRGSMCS